MREEDGMAMAASVREAPGDEGRRRPRRRRIGASAIALTLLMTLGLGAGCTPVTPVKPYASSTFEGFDVWSYIPPDPVGLVYVFHGSYGSANAVTKVEAVDTLNELIRRGYGFVSTDSSLRTGNKRWDAFDPSLTTNPDLARLVRLQQHLVATTGVDADTPLYGIGVSNGARFVTLWGQTWTDAGYPVDAIGAYMGRIANPVVAAGGLDVPTFFVTAENDSTSAPGAIILDYVDTVHAGTPAQLIVAEEQPLSAARFLRIPGVDTGEANAVFQLLVATGAWDGDGRRLVPVADAVARARTITLPAGIDQPNEVANQVALVLAEHEMRGDVKAPVADFFDLHRSGAGRRRP